MISNGNLHPYNLAVKLDYMKLGCVGVKFSKASSSCVALGDDPFKAPNAADGEVAFECENIIVGSLKVRQ